jgi:hypothetical protein
MGDNVYMKFFTVKVFLLAVACFAYMVMPAVPAVASAGYVLTDGRSLWLHTNVPFATLEECLAEANRLYNDLIAQVGQDNVSQGDKLMCVPANPAGDGGDSGVVDFNDGDNNDDTNRTSVPVSQDNQSDSGVPRASESGGDAEAMPYAGEINYTLEGAGGSPYIKTFSGDDALSKCQNEADTLNAGLIEDFGEGVVTQNGYRCTPEVVVSASGSTGDNTMLLGNESAEGSSDGYVLLEPSIVGESGGSITPSEYLARIFWFMIGAAGVLAVLQIALGGIDYMFAGANPGKEKDAKEKIAAAIYGLLLALGAWLILNTINPDFVNFNLTLSKAAVGGSSASSGNYSGGGGSMGGDTGATDGWDTVVDANGYYTAEKTAQDKLLRESLSGATNGDAVVTSTTGNSEPCRYAGQTGCTDLYGIQAAIINEVVYVANHTDGKVLVVGGTETGHSSGVYSHAAGHKVDVDDTPNVNAYVMANFTPTPSLNRDGKYAATAYVNEATGAIWYKESTHWDVLVK